MCRDSKKKHPTILKKGRLSERRNTGYSHESMSKSNAGEASFFRASEVSRSLGGRREESQSMIPKVCISISIVFSSKLKNFVNQF